MLSLNGFSSVLLFCDNFLLSMVKLFGSRSRDITMTLYGLILLSSVYKFGNSSSIIYTVLLWP